MSLQLRHVQEGKKRFHVCWKPTNIDVLMWEGLVLFKGMDIISPMLFVSYWEPSHSLDLSEKLQ